MATWFDDQFNTAGTTAWGSRTPDGTNLFSGLTWTVTPPSGDTSEVSSNQAHTHTAPSSVSAIGTYTLAFIGDGTSAYGHTGDFQVDFAWTSPNTADLTNGAGAGSTILTLSFHGHVQTVLAINTSHVLGTPYMYFCGTWYSLSGVIAANTSYVGQIISQNGAQSLSLFGNTYTAALSSTNANGLNQVLVNLDRNAFLDYVTVQTYSGVTPNTAAFSAFPTSGQAPLSVAFVDNSAAGSANPGATHTVIWDFGDGTPVDTTSNPTHVYAFSGTYHVGLNVVWSAGASPLYATQDITVTAPFWQNFKSCHETP